MSLLVALVGAAVVLLEVFELWRAWRARDWPTAPGVVVDVGVAWSGAMARGAHPTVRYRYVVGGAQLEGSRLKFGAQMGRASERAARAAVRDLAPGAPVAVRYNPRAPREAVLRPGPSGADLAVLLIGAALCAGGFAP